MRMYRVELLIAYAQLGFDQAQTRLVARNVLSMRDDEAAAALEDWERLQLRIQQTQVAALIHLAEMQRLLAAR